MVYEGAIQDLAGQRSAFMIPGGHGDGTIATEPDQHGRDEGGHSNWFSAKGDRGSGHFLKDSLWGVSGSSLNQHI